MPKREMRVGPERLRERKPSAMLTIVAPTSTGEPVLPNSRWYHAAALFILATLPRLRLDWRDNESDCRDN